MSKLDEFTDFGNEMVELTDFGKKMVMSIAECIRDPLGPIDTYHGTVITESPTFTEDGIVFEYPACMFNGAYEEHLQKKMNNVKALGKTTGLWRIPYSNPSPGIKLARCNYDHTSKSWLWLSFEMFKDSVKYQNILTYIKNLNTKEEIIRWNSMKTLLK